MSTPSPEVPVPGRLPGDDRWTGPVQLLDVIDLSPAAKQEMQAWLPRFGFVLDELTRIGEDRLLERDTHAVTAETLDEVFG